MREGGKSHLLVLVLALALTIALGLVSIHVPFGRDQGVAAFVARVMSRGGAVYRDVFHFNLPGIFFTYWLVSRFPIPEGVNALHAAFTALTCIAVYLAARRAMTPLSASFAALFYGAFATVIYTNYWDIAQKDSLASLPLALCLLFTLRMDKAGGRVLDAAIAGALAGLAAQYKPTLGIALLAPLWIAWTARREHKATAPAAASLAGFGASFIPLLVYLFATGTFGAMVESTVRFGGFYGGQFYHGLFRTGWEVLRNLAVWLYDWRLLSSLSAAAVVLAWKDRVIKTIAVFGALLLFQVIVQMKFFTYHWIPLLIPCSILAARGGALILNGVKESGSVPRWAIALVLAALFAGNILPAAKRYRREGLYDLGYISRATFLNPYAPWGKGDICPNAQYAAADYIKSNTAPTDPILVFGHELAFYLLADRFPPTRFAYDQPLTTDPAGNERFEKYRDKLRAEFMQDLEERPPVYVIVIEHDATGIEPRDSYTQMQSFPEFKRLIDNDYRLETKIEDYFIYRRSAPGRGGTR